MKLPGIVIATIETAFNHLIADQRGVVDPILNNHLVCIDLVGLDSRLYFHFIDFRLIVLNDTDRQADATIKGTPMALASAGIGGNTRDIQLSGDLQLARAFETLLKNIEIDWEEILSHCTGDIIAFRIGEMVRGLGHWGRQSAQAFADDLRDYLQIETRQLPLPDEVNTFNRSVDDLRAAVERFELRVLRLKGRLSARKETAS